MGLRDRIREGAAKRKANREAKANRWKNPTQSTSGSGPNKNGDDKHSPKATNSVKSEVKREPQKAATVTKKTVSSVKHKDKTKTPTIKRDMKAPPKRKETAYEFRTRRAAELKSAKEKQSSKQKSVQEDKDAKWDKVAKIKEAAKAKANKPRYTGSDSSGVENKEATKRSGTKQYHSKAELESKKTKEMNARTLAKRKARSKN